MKTFKVGDKVRVIKTMPNWALWQDEMDNLVGETGEILKTDNDDNPPNCRITFDSIIAWWIPNECLELVGTTPQEFTITEPLQDYERF